MFRMGMMSRSAKMNEITPPKLIPPFHSTAASGTFPTEQMKLSSEITGPTSGPHTPASVGLRVKKKVCQKESGTQAASAPAISRPRPMSVARDQRLDNSRQDEA